MVEPTIDITTTAGQVAGRMILAEKGLFRLIVAAFGGRADCEGYVFESKPARPLKGRGHSRHVFDVDASGSARRFYEALPFDHKDKISERGRHGSYTWRCVISDEAKQIWDIYGAFF